MIPIYSNVAVLKEQYDVWLCDIWGVMHNGAIAIEDAVVACQQFRKTGGTVVLLTNAPRPWDSVREQLLHFGVPDDAYCGIVSSGDVTDHLIKSHSGKAVHHIGPLRDAPIIERARIKTVPLEKADLVLLTGLLDDDVETPDDYREILTQIHELGLPLICANPDLMVERGERLVYCAGAVAAVYEEMGGVVNYAGKPFLPIYEMATARAKKISKREIDRSRMICIGDGLKTDMAGAFAAGFDALFVASALHVESELTSELLADLFDGALGMPIGAIDALRW